MTRMPPTPDGPSLTNDVQARHRERVAALYAGGGQGLLVAIRGRFYGAAHGLAGTNSPDMLRRPEAWVADVLADLAASEQELADPDTFRPAAIEMDALGTHFIDALLGARVMLRGGQYWTEPLAAPPDRLRPPEPSRSRPLQAILRLARVATDASRGRGLLVGLPVLSCPINVAINTYGQEFLLWLLDEPGRARRVLRVVTDTILLAARELMAAVPEDLRRTSVVCDRYAPPGYGLIDGCATQLVSASHYRDFIAPLDEETLRAYPRGGMIHLCGASAQHVPAWRAMAALRSVQLNDRAADDAEAYLAGLRRDQVLYFAPTRNMPARRFLALAGDRPVVLQADYREGADVVEKP